MSAKVAFVAKLLLTGVILLVVAHTIDLGKLAALLTDIPAHSVAICGVLLIAQQWITGARFAMVLRLLGHSLGTGSAFRITIESMFFSQAFVSFLGADVFRIWRMGRAGIPLTDAASAVTFDRMNSFAINHLVLLVSLPWMLVLISDATLRIGILVIGAGGIGVFAVAIVLGHLSNRPGGVAWLRNFAARWRLMTIAFEISTVGRLFLRDLGGSLKVSLLSLISVATNAAVFFLILIGLGTPVALAGTCALAIPLVIEIAFLPIALAGWGLRESAAGVLFSALGLDTNVAIAASVAFGLFGLAIGLVGGISWLSNHRKAVSFPLPTSNLSRPTSRTGS